MQSLAYIISNGDTKEVGWLANDNQKDLHALSSQMVDLFIKNIFAKNKINKNQVNLTDEQKESLKQTFDQLKERVDTYVSKQTTEADKEEEEQKDPLSPLREKFFQNRQMKETSSDDESNEEK